MHLQSIRNTLLLNGFFIIKTKRAMMEKNLCEMFYAEHKDRFFFHRLVTFMSSGPVDIYILAHQDAIKRWRQVMGPTKVFQAQFSAPNTIRGVHGLSDTRNASHGSDSKESAQREINILFPNFNTDEWLREEEIYFRTKQVQFIGRKFVHHINQVILPDLKPKSSPTIKL